MNVRTFQIRLTKEYLQVDEDILSEFLNSVLVKKIKTELVIGQPNFWSILVFFQPHQIDLPTISYKPKKISFPKGSILTEKEKRILEALSLWRTAKADEQHITEFRVCRDAELVSISKIVPRKIDDLIKIKGFAYKKVAKYGKDIISIVNSIQHT